MKRGWKKGRDEKDGFKGEEKGCPKLQTKRNCESDRIRLLNLTHKMVALKI